MNQRKQQIFSRSFIRKAVLVLLSFLFILGGSPQPAQASHASECSDVYTPLSDFVNTGVARNKDAYIQVMNETGVPWEFLAAIHYRESSFSRSNPSNGYGIFQFTPPPESYPPGPVTDEEFIRQLRYMANRVQDDYVWRGSVPRERRRLQPNEQNTVIVKDTLFSYNGRASVYADQAAHFGYNRDIQPYEGSPYVMNRFDCQRARMGIITQDYGSIDGIDTRYGAFTIYARLRGGNDNYWKTLWSSYAWSIESFSYSGGDNTIAQGQSEVLTLKARNTGRNPWYNYGANPVRLGTWQPADRKSNLLHGDNRYANLSNDNGANAEGIEPGEVGTFVLQIAPEQMGTYIEAMNLVVENSQWMPWPGLSPTIIVDSGYSWKMESINYSSGTGLMNPGDRQSITLIVKNTGNKTWDKSGPNPVRLGTLPSGRASEVVANGWPNPTRIDINDTPVAPGQTAGFQFDVRMPRGGLFYERFSLVSEGLTWFNDTGLTLYLQGRNLTWQPVWHSHSASTPNMLPGETQDITVKVKNTGEITWQRDGPSPVRLATVAPQDRGSALYHSSWIRDTRPAGLQETTVAPGQEGTFKFTIRAPSTRGPWIERFSLVQENQAWLNNPGFSIYINVL